MHAIGQGHMSIFRSLNCLRITVAGRLTSNRSIHLVHCCQAPSGKQTGPPPVKRITRDDVVIQFARSSGAGGQNVNKVNTKVDMRLHLDSTPWLDEEIREAVKKAEKKRINKEGELVITSQRTRSQAGNVDDALEKLQEIFDAAWKAVQPIEEDPEKKKKLEKQVERGKQERLQAKKMQSDKKKERRAKIEW